MKISTFILASPLLFLGVAPVQAVLVSSFEGGLDGWVVSGFNAQPVTLANSTNGATDGTQSLAVTQTGGGFSWNAKRDNAGNDAFYAAMNGASTNESLWTLELDVTYRDVDIPNGSFLNLSLWINSDNQFKNVHSLALTNTQEDRQVHLAIPLPDFGADALATNSSFYQMGIGMNGDWGPGNATVYFDNVQLTVIPEPAIGGLGLLALGAALIRRRRK
jgi:hypothetical protein